MELANHGSAHSSWETAELCPENMESNAPTYPTPDRPVLRANRGAVTGVFLVMLMVAGIYNLGSPTKIQASASFRGVIQENS